MTNTNITRSKASRTQYLASLRSKIQEMSSPKSSQRQDDERYWKPEVDKAGSGSAVIRFLCAKPEEGFPFVQLWSHGFQGPTGKWFIDSCPTSIEQNCPVCKANTELWNTGNEAKKKLASSRKRKLNYISNILVVNDPKHSENNGKVFLYKYGKKIFEKIKDQIAPPDEFPDMAPVDPFDMEEGANFKLRVTRVDGFPNYDKSSFDNPSILGDEDRRAEIEGLLFSLEEILDPKHFKSFDDLKKRFDLVTGGVVSEEAPVAETEANDEKPPLDEDDGDMPVVKPKAKPKTKPAEKAATPAPKAAVVAPSDDEEDYFAKLAANAEQN
jgi:hypothetical protein